MKNIIIIILTLFIFNCEKPDPLEVETYKLNNGLTVILNEDHNETKVFGAVIVDGGGKRDPSDATGIAHYLEHLLFKGTTEMGTIDYESEKIFLDSIEVLYDKLGSTKNEQKRYTIQKDINRLSVKAAEYAIPNEFDRLIQGMGGTGMNADTWNDFVRYYNSFPSNEIEKWLEVYSHRFINPIFRLFQAELEIVYEEKNRAMDNPFRIFYNTFNKSFFKKHPYGQQTILGSVEHLKNPSLTKMKQNFNEFYVPNNMYLILTGDFEKNKVKGIIKRKFGRLKKGNAIEPLNIQEDQFPGREVVDISITPYRIARMGYRTVKPNHPDALALEVLANIFNNSSKTGLIDKLNTENKILSATGYSGIGGKDHGGFGFGFIPKDDLQTFDQGESLMLGAINDVKNGRFDEGALESIKLNMKMSHERSMEGSSGRLWKIMQIISKNLSWEEIKSYPQRIDNISKDKIVEVANRYLNDNYLIVRSDKGDPEKIKLDKPPFDPVAPKNTEQKSDYAKSIDNIKSSKIKPRFVDFSKDVTFEDIRENIHFYHVENPVNSIFTMNIQFGLGTVESSGLEQASQFISLIGTKNRTFDQFKDELQKIGSKIETYSNNNYFGFIVSGFDNYLNQTLSLLNEFMQEMHVREDDVSKLEKIIEGSKISRDREKNDPTTAGRALREYAMYGKKSSYLRRPTLAEVKAMTPDFLLDQVKNAMQYEVDIFYTGTIGKEEVINQINKELNISNNLIASNSPINIDYKRHTRNKVFIIDDSKAVQSQIYFIAEGKVLDEKQRNIASVFNNYFGRGMGSIIFQEIREFRSLAYSAYGSYINRSDVNMAGYYFGYIGTQVDKTMEAIKTYLDLFNNLPIKENRMSSIKLGLTQSINSRKPNWRGKGGYVANLIKRGYDDDPNKISYQVYNEAEFNDIIEFHKNNIKKNPIVITILTDKSKINIDKILDYGELIELKKENIFN
ncbi:MAG: hypothetical protein CBD77_00955 [bacterium TMED217]|nr:MAG: hypothetical protein CBD77_00955 [bacterium TMED217]|tara:strand:- start:2553 stop:5432 length:2880 start_codon:yes stop_codon:yes gene_type:complete